MESDASILIFCEKKSRIEKICEALKESGIINLGYDESMSTQARNLSLSLVRSG
jgi:superfamily II DNA/RNA helicase